MGPNSNLIYYLLRPCKISQLFLVTSGTTFSCRTNIFFIFFLPFFMKKMNFGTKIHVFAIHFISFTQCIMHINAQGVNRLLAQCLREMGGYCVKEICIYSVCICMSWIVSDLFIKVKNKIKKRTHAPFFKEIVTRNN